MPTVAWAYLLPGRCGLQMKQTPSLARWWVRPLHLNHYEFKSTWWTDRELIHSYSVHKVILTSLGSHKTIFLIFLNAILKHPKTVERKLDFLLLKFPILCRILSVEKVKHWPPAVGKVSPWNVRRRAGGGQVAAHLKELCSWTTTCLLEGLLMALHCLASTFWKQQFPKPSGQEFTGNGPQNPTLLRLDLFFFRNVITRVAVG